MDRTDEKRSNRSKETGGRSRLRVWQVALRTVALLTIAAAGWRATGFGVDRKPTPGEIAERFWAESDDAPAGGANPDAGPLFRDVAPALGITFNHDNALRGRFFLPEEMGPGAAFVDYDGDGDLDVFVTGGGRIVDDGAVQTCRLYRNDGERFTDVTGESGAGVPGPAYGVACADYDDDGDVDILVTRLGPNALLRNDGHGGFEDIAVEAGVADAGFGAGAAFFDYDRDGRLDLYVTNYVDWSPQREKPCYTILGIRDFCNPKGYGPPPVHRLYHNIGGGRFEDVTTAAGIGAARGHGLGVVASDFDGDGWPDLYVANDQTPAFLWHNNRDGTFSETAEIAGCAYDGRGVAIAGMGLACEDLDDDGDLDLLVTNINGQLHLALRNDGGRFEDVSAALGLGPWSAPYTTFGVALFDQDHDGRLDAFFANGGVNIREQAAVAENPYAQPDHFMRLDGGRFVNATEQSGAAFMDVGRAVAAGDYDNDGDVDLLLTNNGGPLRLLRNENENQYAWLTVRTRLGPGGRAAIGARVEVEAGGRVVRREIRPQQSYLASGDPRAHFGLGRADRVDRVSIIWPDGTRTDRRDVAVNQVLTIQHAGVGDSPQ